MLREAFELNNDDGVVAVFAALTEVVPSSPASNTIVCSALFNAWHTVCAQLMFVAP